MWFFFPRAVCYNEEEMFCWEPKQKYVWAEHCDLLFSTHGKYCSGQNYSSFLTKPAYV